VQHLTADVVLLDQLLVQYGPEARPIRELLRQALGPLVDRLWRESGTVVDAPFVATAASEAAFSKIGELTPQTDAQRSLKARADQVSTDLAQTRLALFVQAGSSIPMPFLAVLVFWLAIIFAFHPRSLLGDLGARHGSLHGRRQGGHRPVGKGIHRSLGEL
jgi:hypothetical protein